MEGVNILCDPEHHNVKALEVAYFTISVLFVISISCAGPEYGFGWRRDFVVVAAFVLILLALRELVSELVLKPIARNFVRRSHVHVCQLSRFASKTRSVMYPYTFVCAKAPSMTNNMSFKEIIPLRTPKLARSAEN